MSNPERWDFEALSRAYGETQPIQDPTFFLGQLRDLVAQANALRAFFDAEHVHRWSVGAEVEPTFQTLQAARKEVVRACGFHKEPRQK